MLKITWCNLCPPSYGQKKVIEEIVNPSLFDGEGQSLIANNRTAYFRFFHGAPTPQNKLFVKCMNHLLKNRPQIDIIHKTYRPSQFHPWNCFRETWKKVLNDMHPKEKKIYASHINDMIEKTNTDSATKECKAPIGNKFWENTYFEFSSFDLSDALGTQENLSEKLASLSLIATTWPLWENFNNRRAYQENILRLARFMFPNVDIKIMREDMTPSSASHFKTKSLSDIFNLCKEDEAKAHKMVKAAKQATLELKPDYSNAIELRNNIFYAGKLCEKIISVYRCANDYTLGNALFILGCCCEAGYPIPETFDSMEEIFNDAVFYGYEENIEHIKYPAILEIPRHAISSTSGICIVNENNSASDWIDKTIPVLWSFECHNEPSTQLKPDTHQRFVLISDNFEKNIKDALKILDKIKKNTTIKLSRWRNIEIFIRCNEEKTALLIDTALNFMDRYNEKAANYIRIYLIDDAKNAAQSLYSRHPLFYSPASIKRKSDVAGNNIINIVILAGNKNVELATWLIREAFWFSVSLKMNYSARITVLSPFSEIISSKVSSACPGLASFSAIDSLKQKSTNTINIDNIPFPSISYISTALSGYDLLHALDEITASSNSKYYIVDKGNDFDNLDLAIKIREREIQNTIMSNRLSRFSQNRSVITFYCEDSDYARLAQNLIVPKDENGNQWFNNYGFVTFGSLKSRYSWDMLDGGIISKIAQCIHLQYSNEQPNNSYNYKNITTYFNRIYNRESSIACALSLPYRLNEEKINLQTWNIQDPSAYWSNTQRSNLAKAMEKALFPGGQKKGCNEELILKLAMYEHARWCAYMLSRGWLPATPDQTINYIQNGSTRHNLYIAKLHPCICSWEGLSKLQTILCMPLESDNPDTRFQKYSAVDYFTSMDFENIKKTPELLRVSWFHSPNENSEL